MEKQQLDSNDVYDNWLNTLKGIYKENFIYLVKYSFFWADRKRANNNDLFLFGYHLASEKFKTKMEYIDNEIYSMYKELGKTKTYVPWYLYREIVKQIQDAIDDLKKKKSYEMQISDNKDGLEMQVFLIDDEYLYGMLFYFNLIYLEDFMDLLSHPIDFYNNQEFEDVIIPELSGINEFLGKFLFFVQLFNYSCYRDQFKYNIDNPIKGSLPLTFDNKNKRNLQPLTFENLFRDKKNAQKVKEILELNGYTENGQWNGVSGKLSELSCAYFVLRGRFVLIPGQVAPQVKTFYQKFKLHEDYTSIKTMTTPINNDDRKEFERIFSHLI